MALKLIDQPIECAVGILVVYISGYIIYQRFFHPLAKYPGPFLASLTDLWQVYQFMTLKQPYTLTKLHEKYGSIVRYGPDKLSVTDEDAVRLIYQTGARYMPKTEFYDAYGAAHPNVFGMRDEAAHSIRRRHMSHSFSMSYVKEMEQYLDANIKILRDKISRHALNDELFDLKKTLHYYTIDVLGELAFSQTFGIQESDDESRIPPVIEHSLLAAVTGAWPAMTMTLKKWLPKIPHKGLQALFKGRKACADLASRCVNIRLSTLRSKNGTPKDLPERKDILTNLINAKHPDTGESLTQTDLETEAFGFIIAGTHTTSATATLLFYHLLHNTNLMNQCVTEIDEKLPSLQPNQSAYSVTDAEASLPFLRNCIKENFRITPVFTMPLARRVLNAEGVIIAGNHIPCRSVITHSIIIRRFGGADHNVFDPSRWDIPGVASKGRLLMHFGLGGRQCIGKTVAMSNIYKLMSTLLKEFQFELADEEEKAKVQRGGFQGEIPEMISVGISDLASPLMVKARKRN
ncbi:hypothetical protein N7533_005230 [Penicillium manginii]|uniref:uncharacterized protein n=1 Tax=Penicillium manginii TaxID=203109 RepID=UPI002546D0BE|nr:uncharacterized protein N7533_005230 [Penicillium manginii]KAJ5755687.1 hypothetical protein N7533_005230 [Penicillium manginii]